MRKNIICRAPSTFPKDRQSLLAARVKLIDGTIGTIARDFGKGSYEMLVKGIARKISQSEVALIGEDVKHRTGMIAKQIGAIFCPMSLLAS
jgi:hypothetical protein